jgi:Activator of Hsp90 ATPase homolog 1-like protein
VTPPLTLDFEVRCGAQHAFEVWTTRTSLWWPVNHSVSSADGLVVTIEPWIGGRVFERTPEGVEHDWGEVTVWEPPLRLGHTWHLRRDRADATDVLIVFSPEGAERCRVSIHHSGWERLGAEATQWREANHNRWADLLPHFVTAAER